MTVVEILEGKCGYFSMDVIKTSFLNCKLATSTLHISLLHLYINYKKGPLNKIENVGLHMCC